MSAKNVWYNVSIFNYYWLEQSQRKFNSKAKYIRSGLYILMLVKRLLTFVNIKTLYSIRFDCKTYIEKIP